MKAQLYLEERLWFCDLEIGLAAYDDVVLKILCKLEIN